MRGMRQTCLTQSNSAGSGRPALVGPGRELVALLLVEVDVSDLHLRLEVVGGNTETRARVTDGNVRPETTIASTRPVDVDLDAVVDARGGGRTRG